MLNPALFSDANLPAVPVYVVDEGAWLKLKMSFSPLAQAIASHHRFEAKEGSVLLITGATGALDQVIVGAGKSLAQCDPFVLSKLNDSLPDGDYALDTASLYRDGSSDTAVDLTLLTLGFLMGRYRFERYKTATLSKVRLRIPCGVSNNVADEVDAHDVSRIMAGVTLGRDLINTPAHDCSPQTLEDTSISLAQRFNASINVMRADALLSQNFPMIHAVGRASNGDLKREPRLIDLKWQPQTHGDAQVATLPSITLVGKGVCFDTGGLNIKSDSGMLLMKKDMGGAACVLAIASMVMDAQLPLRLRVLIPAVENSIAGNAFRPGDVLQSRKGLSVEIGNTDAEGRLILADALTYADEEQPDLIIDVATLTGAARVALGPDLPPLMCNDDTLAGALMSSAENTHDPIWRLPLWNPYESMLNSKIADTNNISSTSYAGTILAGLFLRKFISIERQWAHFDIFGWTPTAKLGKPEGGEVNAARLIYHYLKTFSQKRT